MNTQSPLGIQTYYPNSPHSSTDTSSRDSMMNTPIPSDTYSPANYHHLHHQQNQNHNQSQNHNQVQNYQDHQFEQQYQEYHHHQEAQPHHQLPPQFEPTNSSNSRAYYCPYPSTTETIQAPVTVASAAPLPAIAHLMKEVQIKEEFNEYYAPNPSMNDYRVEKIANPLADPYIQIEQPIYTDFANAPMLNQQDMLNPMNFSTNYMGATQFSHQQTVQLNLLDLSGFSTFNSCDPALPLMHQSPSQQNYVMPHSTFTPPPQDPLVAEQKPLVKKRMAAVQCHQNSICSNCKTRETTLWRRNGEGGVECNACNLYFRKNNRKRPLSLRKDGIMKRNRRPRNESPNGIRRQATC